MDEYANAIKKAIAAHPKDAGPELDVVKLLLQDAQAKVQHYIDYPLDGAEG